MRTLQAISNNIVHDNVSTVLAIIIDFQGPGVGHAYVYKRFSNSMVHENLSAVSATITDFDGVGVRHAYFYKFLIASSLTMSAPANTIGCMKS